MEENKYLLYSHYKIKESNNGPEIITLAARKSMLEFCRLPSFQNRVGVTNRGEVDSAVQKMLAAQIPLLFECVDGSEESQAAFDNKHKEICERIIQMYSGLGTLSYGIAQRWLNLTLMNLVVIEANMKTGFWPIESSRKYFHVCVEKYLLEAAARKTPNRYQHGLGLKCAPVRAENANGYTMEWYVFGDEIPQEDWEYPEYIEFQRAVRQRLKEIGSYQDPLDWAFKAYLEVAQARIKWV